MWHVSLLEHQIDKLRKDQCQKQFLLDSLDQALQSQKGKAEEAKSEAASLQLELAALSDLCRDLQRQCAKLLNDITVKEKQNSSLSGRLDSSKEWKRNSPCHRLKSQDLLLRYLGWQNCCLP